jgi:hypothetical protein
MNLCTTETLALISVETWADLEPKNRMATIFTLEKLRLTRSTSVCVLPDIYAI